MLPDTNYMYGKGAPSSFTKHAIKCEAMSEIRHIPISKPSPSRQYKVLGMQSALE